MSEDGTDLSLEGVK